MCTRTRTRTRTRRAHGVCGELAGTYCLVVTRLLRLVRGSRCAECQPAHRCNRRARQVHPFARPDRHLGNSTLDGVRCLEETHDQHVHFVVQLAQTRAHGRNVRLQRAWCGHGSAGTCTRAATSPRQQDARAVSISDNQPQPRLCGRAAERAEGPPELQWCATAGIRGAPPAGTRTRRPDSPQTSAPASKLWGTCPWPGTADGEGRHQTCAPCKVVQPVPVTTRM